MNTAFLAYESTLLTPEARWLLTQWASKKGLDQPVECSPRDLFAELGLTYAQGRRAWQVLTCKRGKQQEQFVEVERLPRKGPGRYKSRYLLSAKLLKALAKSSLPVSNCHAEEIITLAKTSRLSSIEERIDLREGSRRRRTGLTLPNRWLLMVLLAHADSPGTVTRLSVSALRRLTGMSSFRITNQLKKLCGLGLIAHHQPGRYAPKATTRKTSIYLLDLEHPLLGKRVRAPATILSLPSSRKFKRTELVGGIVDAVMTAGVCSLQIEALLKEYDANKDSDSTVSDDTKDESKREHDPYREAKNYQEKYIQLKRIFNEARSLLPSTRYLESGIEELVKYYDADDANWLLTSVHIDACHLLTSSWNELKEGFFGPEQPCHDVIVATARRLGIAPEYVIEAKPGQESECASEKADNYKKALDDNKPHRSPEVDPITGQISYPPLALLFYALSHHLAKQLQRVFTLDEHENVEAMTYMLVPVFPNSPNGPSLPAFQLRCYCLRSEGTDQEPTTTIFLSSVSEDLKTYWQTYHQDCL